jgi:hypothetical protein
MEYVGRLIQLAIMVLWLAGMWKVFEKAGKPGWAAIIPIYNIIVLLQIVGKPIWWIVLYIVIIGHFLVAMELAERFGKSKGWGIALLGFFPFVGYPMIGFGDETYTAPAGSA